MKYALVNGERIEARPGLSGQCQICDCPTVAKCGKIKIWHWAHKGKRICDPWWENETEWHRAWKGQFLKECQEIIQYAEDGEKHIADVKTADGWVIEFQHSYIKPAELSSRNAFYGKLVWVVDGMRRARDKLQFIKLLNEPNLVTLNGKIMSPQVRKVDLDDCTLLKEWSGIQAPVLFDFGEAVLWCLLPSGQTTNGYIVPFPRHEFIELHNNAANQIKAFENCLNNLNAMINLISQHFNSAIRINRAPKVDPLDALLMARRRR